MGKIIVFTSGKGGSGKTALTAAVGGAMARLGKNVCLADVCYGLRGLDMALGLQDHVVFDLHDLSEEDCAMEQALLKAETENLCLVAAPQLYVSSQEGEKPLRRTLERLKKRFDYVLVDAPGLPAWTTRAACGAADAAVLINVPGDAAARNTERASAEVRGYTQAPLYMVMNCFAPRMAAGGKAAPPDALAVYLDIPLLGIVPLCEEIYASGAADGRVFEWPQKAEKAIDEIARRLNGEEIPVKAHCKRRFPWHF